MKSGCTMTRSAASPAAIRARTAGEGSKPRPTAMPVSAVKAAARRVSAGCSGISASSLMPGSHRPHPSRPPAPHRAPHPHDRCSAGMGRLLAGLVSCRDSRATTRADQRLQRRLQRIRRGAAVDLLPADAEREGLGVLPPLRRVRQRRLGPAIERVGLGPSPLGLRHIGLEGGELADRRRLMRGEDRRPAAAAPGRRGPASARSSGR